MAQSGLHPGATNPTYPTGPIDNYNQYRVFVYANQNGCEDVILQWLQ